MKRKRTKPQTGAKPASDDYVPPPGYAHAADGTLVKLDPLGATIMANIDRYVSTPGERAAKLEVYAAQDAAKEAARNGPPKKTVYPPPGQAAAATAAQDDGQEEPIF